MSQMTTEYDGLKSQMITEYDDLESQLATGYDDLKNQLNAEHDDSEDELNYKKSRRKQLDGMNHEPITRLNCEKPWTMASVLRKEKIQKTAVGNHGYPRSAAAAVNEVWR